MLLDFDFSREAYRRNHYNDKVSLSLIRSCSVWANDNIGLYTDVVGSSQSGSSDDREPWDTIGWNISTLCIGLNFGARITVLFGLNSLLVRDYGERFFIIIILVSNLFVLSKYINIGPYGEPAAIVAI